MTPPDARAAIGRLFMTAAAAIGIPAQGDINEPFDPPPGALWARLTVKDGNERPVGVGGPGAQPCRTTILAYIDVFGPGGVGDGGVGQAVERMRPYFRNYNGGQLRFQRFDAGPEGRQSGSTIAGYGKQIIAVFVLSARN